MIINQILRGIRRLFMGSTYHFTTRKDSSTFNNASWTELYHEVTEYPIKLISIEILTEKDIQGEYRICVNSEKIFPFGDSSKIDNMTRNFLVPISVAADSFLQIEIRSGIQNKSVCILSELAVVEIL
jgi:hypothetical protein